ncbi:hypothetical protein [Polaromonas sp. JS666]|uniref:hypothetical protein n=1 Tax=Polaromonas sp. (strain JS666 / ATCC BAA-500) TaxID=296591 RepID=UPI00111429A3|nr:hypothetical protein [Polaromonas sp. JS666]
MLRSLISVFVVLSAFLLAGCAATSVYKSPDLPQGGPDAIAVLEHEHFGGAKFFITDIDGQPRGFGWFSRFELTPGRRSVTAGINSSSFKGAGITRYFNAEPGKTYTFAVQDDPKAMRWSFSIVEKNSGTRVDSGTP